MALVTRGTAKDGRIRITSTLADDGDGKLSVVIRGGYRVLVTNEYAGDVWSFWVYRIKDNARLGAKDYANAPGFTFDIEMIGSTIKVTHVETAATLLTLTDSTVITAGVWQSDPDYCDFVSFTNLDAPAAYTVDISAGSGGSVSTAQLTDVDDTTGKTFTATPSAGYRIASITASAGVTVTPAASGQTGATEFTVTASQSGTVDVVFEIIPAPPHNHNALFMGAGF